jgi:hypothetical protein
MRLFEIAIALLLSLYLLWPHPRPGSIRLLPALGLIAMAVHFWVEGYRWQMIPLYVLVILLTMISLAKIKSTNDWPAYASYLTVILLLLSTALPILLPVPKIPKPSGPYAIGAAIYEMTDSSRRELYSDKDESRRFMIQVWYPAEVKSTDVNAPWVTNANILPWSISPPIKTRSLQHQTNHFRSFCSRMVGRDSMHKTAGRPLNWQATDM